MAYTGGTFAAIKCIAELTSTGELVDVYSKEWLGLRPDFSRYSIDDLTEYQQQSNSNCEGHLLVITPSLDIKLVGDLLTDAHAGFKQHFDDQTAYYKPNLIFINLATQQILCIGLGRDNCFFGFAIDKGDVNINDRNISDFIEFEDNPRSNKETLAFMQDFLKYDYGNVVIALMESLYEFGSSVRYFNNLPLMPDQIEEILDQGPSKDGLYQIGYELMTLEEARDIMDDYEKSENWCTEHLITIQEFFPQLTWGDISTGAK